MKILNYLFLLIWLPFQSEASHIFGADLTYKHVSGQTYEITIVLYGDCSGSSFQSLYSSIPNVEIYNGTSAYSNINLQPFGTPGVEVTPVCPQYLSSTNCNGGNIPGVKQFTFKGNITLSGPSANWKFVFDGDLGANAATGRSGSIDNIVAPGSNSSIMRLEATLNNSSSVGNNNAASYTTIPTPFFCINLPHQYNQGAVDADGDVLSYTMIPGLEAGGGFVTYANGYTFTNPLDVQAGSFSFDANSGQMNFIPNLVSSYLVVTKVTETRNGVVVGTTMREMVFVIQNNCNNQSPSGVFTTSSIGNVSNTVISICDDGSDSLHAVINVTDPDLQNINVSINGLPSFATATIIDNNTSNPKIHLDVDIPSPFLLGDFSFFITYTDDGCPLSSKTTTAYTLKLISPYSGIALITTNESCSPGNDGSITVNGQSTSGSITYALDLAPFQLSNFFGNLSAGTYQVTLMDSKGCFNTQTAIINPAQLPVIDSIRVKDISCHNENDGSVALFVTSASACTYTLLPINIINSSGQFNNLSEGIYTLVVKDSYACSNSVTFEIINPPLLAFSALDIQPLTCDKNNGKIIVTANITASNYLLMPGIGANQTGVFENLPSNSYTLTVGTGNGCYIDTVIFVGVIPNNFSAVTNQINLPCLGDGDEGEAEVIASGGVAPYTYLWTGRDITSQTTSKISNLYYGWYFVTTTDATGCQTSDTVHILPGTCCENIFTPTAFTPNGDGANDVWRMVTSTGIEIQQFAVFNRWGDKIWKSRDQRGEWDGRQDGRLVDNGTYFFMLRYKCLSDGKTYMKKGDINVIH